MSPLPGEKGRSLRVKLLVPLLALTGVLALLGGLLSHWIFVDALRTQHRTQAETLVSTIHYAAETTASPADLQRQIMALGGERRVRQIVMAAGDPARVLAATRNAWLGMHLEELPANELRSALRMALAEGTPSQVNAEGDGWYRMAQPLPLRNPELASGRLQRAVVAVEIDTTAGAAASAREAWALAGGLALLVLAAGALIHVLVTRLVVRPAAIIGETMRRRAGGDERAYAQVHGNDEIGSVARTLNTMLDALRASEARYTAIVSSAMDGIIVVDEAHRMVVFNEAAERIFGYDARDALDKPLDLLLPARFAAHHRELMNGFAASVSPGRRMLSRNEVVGRRADGEEFPIEASISKSEVNGKVYLTAIVRDVTDQRRAERQLLAAQAELEQRVAERTEELQAAVAAARLSESRLNEAQRMALVANWELDLATNALYWSDEIFRMFELDKSRFGASYEAFLNAIHPDDRNRVNEAYTNSLKTREPYVIRHRLQMADGRIKFVEERCETFYDADGKPLRSVGTVQDVSREVEAQEAVRRANEELQTLNETLERRVEERTLELRVAKEQAERASRAKSDFLSHMSHELRTPMNAILGFGQLLALGASKEDQVQFAGEILGAGNHLLELIDELLDLSRIEAGRLAMALRPVDLRQSVAEALKLTEPQMVAKAVTLVNHIDGCADIHVLADVTRLRQVLVNLLSNAAKYNREEGRITLDCQYRASGRVRVTVRDTGRGIAAEKLARLFVPFERLGAEHTDIQGTGIGLALSRQLIELMGGEIGAESQPGQGSTFWFELPATRAPAGRSAGAPRGAGPGRPKDSAVLYIEDNAANLRLVESFLERRPATALLSATTGEYGVELAQRYRPALILCDIKLPGIDGYEVLACLRASPETASIPVIAVSADAMPHDVERGLAAGFFRYLTKPIDMRALMAAMDEALAARASPTA